MRSSILPSKCQNFEAKPYIRHIRARSETGLDRTARVLVLQRHRERNSGHSIRCFPFPSKSLCLSRLGRPFDRRMARLHDGIGRGKLWHAGLARWSGKKYINRYGWSTHSVRIPEMPPCTPSQFRSCTPRLGSPFQDASDDVYPSTSPQLSFSQSIALRLQDLRDINLYNTSAHCICHRPCVPVLTVLSTLAPSSSLVDWKNKDHLDLFEASVPEFSQSERDCKTYPNVLT